MLERILTPKKQTQVVPYTRMSELKLTNALNSNSSVVTVLQKEHIGYSDISDFEGTFVARCLVCETGIHTLLPGRNLLVLQDTFTRQVY